MIQGMIASTGSAAYREAMLLRHLARSSMFGWLAIALPASGAAQTTMPEMHGAKIVLTADEGTAGLDAVSQCLTDAGMRQEAPAQYVVRFSRAIRPRKMVVELGAKDAAPGDSRRGVRSGRTIEIAALTVSEVQSGKVVLKTEVARKIGRKPRDPALIVGELCNVIRQPAGEPGRRT